MLLKKIEIWGGKTLISRKKRLFKNVQKILLIRNMSLYFISLREIPAKKQYIVCVDKINYL